MHHQVQQLGDLGLERLRMRGRIDVHAVYPVNQKLRSCWDITRWDRGSSGHANHPLGGRVVCMEGQADQATQRPGCTAWRPRSGGGPSARRRSRLAARLQQRGSGLGIAVSMTGPGAARTCRPDGSAASRRCGWEPPPASAQQAVGLADAIDVMTCDVRPEVWPAGRPSPASGRPDRGRRPIARHQPERRQASQRWRRHPKIPFETVA